MDGLTEVSQASFTLFGQLVTFNPVTFGMTWVVIAIILGFALLVRSNIQLIPGPFQSFFEIIYEFLSDITLGTLGEEDGKRHLPFIVTLFIFILLANWIGILPNIFALFALVLAFLHKIIGGEVQFVVNSLTDITFQVSTNTWYTFLMDMPSFEEPTRSVNTDLALAILVFILVWAYGIRNKGIVGFLRSFFDDPFPMTGWKAFFFFVNPFFYLNLISAVANVVSHSFRLFGNIFGGGMIIVIVSTLLKYFLVPVGLFAFFGIFAGLVQAFVFTMLAVTYIQQQQG